MSERDRRADITSFWLRKHKMHLFKLHLEVLNVIYFVSIPKKQAIKTGNTVQERPYVRFFFATMTLDCLFLYINRNENFASSLFQTTTLT
jgi:hypothetical protein